MSKAFVDPVATALMIHEYHVDIEHKELSVDLGEKIYKVSSKFRKLVDHDKSEELQMEIQ